MRDRFGFQWIAAGLAVALSLGVGAAPASSQRVGPEFPVDINTGSGQHQPAIAADADGNFVVVWVNYAQDGFQYGVIGRRFGSAGNPLGGEFQVNTFTTGSQYQPSVSASDDGGFAVVWTGLWGQDGSESGIFGQRFDESGGPLGGEFGVNTYTTGVQLHPAVASDPAGNFLVVWSSYHVSDVDVFGQIYDAGGDPVGGEFQVNTFTTGTQHFPAVAANASGDFIVVWHSVGQDGSGAGVFARRFNASGAPLGPEFQANTYTTFSQTYPAIAANGSGQFVVVWQSDFQDGSEAGIFGQRFDAAGLPDGSEFQINTYSTNRQSYPAVAMTDSGAFIATWQSALQDGWADGIYGRAFGSPGSPIGEEFRVNSHTTGGQEVPVVTSDRSGTFVASWTSLTSDPDNLGVRGQLLAILVFSDGFEAGDVCAWSDSTGGGACP